jgi:CheY-like chemotaxis protein
VEDRKLHLRWEERGGPPTQVPTKRGFGTTLIEQSARGEGGAARIIVASEGLSWDIVLPLPQLTAVDNLSATRFVGGEPASQGAQRTEPTSGRLAGKRFLVVEDEPLVALDVADGLTRAGADVVASVASSREALEVVENGELDAALLDGNLRGRGRDCGRIDAAQCAVRLRQRLRPGQPATCVPRGCPAQQTIQRAAAARRRGAAGCAGGGPHSVT